MLLVLVRHGLTDLTRTRLIGRLPGVDLNDEGRRQASVAADLVAPLRPAAIYSSPMARTMQTAAPLAARTGLAVVEVPGLLEVDFGEWAGQEYTVLGKTDTWKLVQRHPSRARFPGGESIAEAQARVTATIEDLAVRHAEETVVAYTHNDVVKLAVAHYVGMHLDLFQRTSVAPGSITALRIGAGHPVLLRLGATAGLEDLRAPARRKRKN